MKTLLQKACQKFAIPFNETFDGYFNKCVHTNCIVACEFEFLFKQFSRLFLCVSTTYYRSLFTMVTAGYYNLLANCELTMSKYPVKILHAMKQIYEGHFS